MLSPQWYPKQKRIPDPEPEGLINIPLTRIQVLQYLESQNIVLQPQNNCSRPQNKKIIRHSIVSSVTAK